MFSLPMLALAATAAPEPAKKRKQRRSGPPAPQTPLEEVERHLLAADLILINSSGGKDSQTALEETVNTCDRLGIARNKLVVVHADLGEVEWEGTKELAREQAEHYGLKFEVIRYRTKGTHQEITLLEHIVKRGRWPDTNNRYCTSDFKRNPITRVVTKYAKLAGWRKKLALCPGQRKFRVVNVLGMRAAESSARRLLPNWELNKGGSGTLREVHNWLPIFKLSHAEVWDRIHASGVRYHRAYDLGMPRLSCCFCIFSPRSALILAGQHNRQLLRKYAAAETQMGHQFTQKVSIREVLAAVEAGEGAGAVDDWEM